MGWGRPSACGRCGSCQRCKRAAYAREWYAKKTFEERRELRSGRDIERVRRQGRERHERKRNDPEYQARRLAVTAVNNAIRDGRTKRECCEACGSDAQAHHDDYSKLLDVRWLCTQHHAEHHTVLS